MNGLLCLKRQLSALLADAADRRQQLNAYLPTRLGKQAQQVRNQVVIANERCNWINLTTAPVLNRHRLQWGSAINGAGQQAAVEGAQAAAIGSGAFREDQQRQGIAQLLADLLAQALGVTATAADEQRPGLLGKPAASDGLRPWTETITE